MQEVAQEVALTVSVISSARVVGILTEGRTLAACNAARYSES